MFVSLKDHFSTQEKKPEFVGSYDPFEYFFSIQTFTGVELITSPFQPTYSIRSVQLIPLD
jgi:hypothetical protein